MMELRTLWKRMRSPRLWRRGAAVRVHPPEELKVIIDREKTRCDRNCHEFSLMLIEAGREGEESSFVRRLVEILSRRIRCTDDVGWLDRSRLAVVLPDTPRGGAESFAGDIARRIAEGGDPVPSWSIFTYPFQRIPRAPGENGSGSGSGGLRQMTFAEISPEPGKWPCGSPGGGGGSSPDGASPPGGKGNGSGPAVEAAGGFAGDVGPADCPGMAPFRLIPPWKRAMDCAGAVFLALLWAPFFLLAALWVKLVSPGPVFFRQTRIGAGGRPFTCWKLRTMRPEARTDLHRRYVKSLIRSGDGMDPGKPMVKLDREDSRIVPLGKIIRMVGLDELPQVVNVLRGEMSLVGPRPCLPEEYEEYRLWHTRRCDALPGLTGLWQVSGKNKTTFLEMMRMDINYVRKASFWLDVKILLLTIPAIIGQFRQ